MASPTDPASIPFKFQGQKFISVSAVGHSSNSSSSCSADLLHPEPENLRGASRDLDRKRRVIVVDDDDDGDDEAGTLSLKLGVQSQVGLGESCGNKTKLAVGGPLKSAVCQVEGCGFDLCSAKEYHKRHKVCEKHTKATKALLEMLCSSFVSSVVASDFFIRVLSCRFRYKVEQFDTLKKRRRRSLLLF